MIEEYRKMARVLPYVTVDCVWWAWVMIVPSELSANEHNPTIGLKVKVKRNDKSKRKKPLSSFSFACKKSQN